MLLLKLKKMHSVLEFNQSQRLNPYVKFNTQKKIEADKNGDKDRKVLYKILNNAVNGKTTESLRNRIDVRFVSNKKEFLKWASKPSYMSQRIFDNIRQYLAIVAKHKRKVALTPSNHNGQHLLGCGY